MRFHTFEEKQNSRKRVHVKKKLNKLIDVNMKYFEIILKTYLDLLINPLYALFIQG